MSVKVVFSGCPECGVVDGGTLIDIEIYESVEAVKTELEKQGWLNMGGRRRIEWREHPQGGEHVVVGQGSVWILPEEIKEIDRG